jgi:inorganic pyrophosphatase/exopolyphosphatase
MSTITSPSSSLHLNDFLHRSHTHLHRLGDETVVHVVVGNEAADPDSCVCAIALAAALDASLRSSSGQSSFVVAPLLGIRRADFKLQLDRVHLLRRAGLAGGGGDGPLWCPEHITFADEVDLAALAARPAGLRLHLVDHNKLSAPLAALGPHVASIVDHHADEGLYHETVPPESRHVELGIGSCASLVAERLRALGSPLLADPSVCTLLLGAVLLDTVNLDASAKAQKAREQSIANELLLPCAAAMLGVPPDEAGRGAFFGELLRVKADVSLLLGFPTADLLRQDYKEEALMGGGLKLGVGSVVLPLPALLARQPLSALDDDMRSFAAAKQLQLLLLMSVDLDARQRYLLLSCEDAGLAEQALRVLAPLQLIPLDANGAGAGQAGGLRTFAQGDYSISRKGLLPLLRDGLVAKL